MNPLLCYVRDRLQRRLFVWFGLTILLTGLAVSGVLSATGAEVGWRRETQRVSAFMSGRFERVWDAPAERDELAQAMSHDLDSTVTLEGPTPDRRSRASAQPARRPRCASRCTARGRSSVR